jgi:hypothetical protein
MTNGPSALAAMSNQPVGTALVAVALRRRGEAGDGE